MRLFALFAICMAIIAVGSAAPATEGANTHVNPTCFSELKCSMFINQPLASLSIEHSLTNAQRFARGLPPKHPRRRFSPTGVQAVRRQEPSGVPVRGRIRVARADGTGDLGYLSSHPFNLAQHRYDTIDNAMIVNFRNTGTSQDQLDINTENSDVQSIFPRLSLVQGRDNVNSELIVSTYQHVYISGSDATAPGAIPRNIPNAYTASGQRARSAESAVWSYDPSTQMIAPQWINSDGSAPALTVFTQSMALYVSADPAAFADHYPSPVITLNLFFESLT